MAPIRLGKFSVEIAVNSIDGFIHELIDLPIKNGFWVTFTVHDQPGRILPDNCRVYTASGSCASAMFVL